MKIIKNAQVYAPAPLGKKDILIEGEKIVRLADAINEYDAIDEVEKIDAGGRTVVPGYLDIHEHITGGGGEGGPTTRVPESQLSVIVGSGVTTVVGLLGTDGISRSLENLLEKTKSYNELGITCFMLTGSYGLPTVTLTGDAERDIMLFSQIIGVKTSMSDHRSSNITGEELIRLATAARRGGLLAGKAGFTCIHMGDSPRKLEPLFYAIDHADVPISKFLPTHMTRNSDLFEDGIEFMKRGGFIDVTAGETMEDNRKVADMLVHAFAEAGYDNMTMTSDGYGSMPKFNEKKELIGLTYSTPKSLHQLIKVLVKEKDVPLEEALKLLTITPARVINQTGIKGTIAAGADADLIIYDDDMEVNTVFARGRLAVDHKNILMKGKFE
ncbi:MAG: beta-aspartyl-peptidase [Solobacterium sp.]|nr:beta-aspartyl-peptidase [Solobacterium sp.]